MHTANLAGDPLATFVDQVRSVLHIRTTSPVREPDAIETWSEGNGYMWTWTAGYDRFRGQWTIHAGAPLDPAPVLTCPAGVWRFRRPDRATGDKLLMLLRLAGGIPAQPNPANPADWDRRPTGRTLQPGESPLRDAVLVRDGTRIPNLPDGYVPVFLVGEPDGDWIQEVVMPDGGRSYFNPYQGGILTWTDHNTVHGVRVYPNQPVGHIPASPPPNGPDAVPLVDDPAVAAAQRAEAAAGAVSAAQRAIADGPHPQWVDGPQAWSLRMRPVPAVQTDEFHATPPADPDRAVGTAQVTGTSLTPEDLPGLRPATDREMAGPWPEGAVVEDQQHGGPVGHVTEHADDTTPPPPAHHPGGATSSGDTW